MLSQRIPEQLNRFYSVQNLRFNPLSILQRESYDFLVDDVKPTSISLDNFLKSMKKFGVIGGNHASLTYAKIFG